MFVIGKKALSGGEYALMLGVISLTLVAGFETFTGQMTDTFDKLNTKLDTISSEIVTESSNLVAMLPGYLEPATPPSTGSYLYNASKEPTSYEFPNYLLTYWTERSFSGFLNNRYDLKSDSSFPEQTYAIGPSSEMNCVGGYGNYCWLKILTGDGVIDGSYNGDPIAISGSRVAITDFMASARDFVEKNTAVDYIYFSNFTDSLYFSPLKPYNWNGGWPINVRIDGNQKETNILTNSLARGSYMLEDGVFNVAFPFTNTALYNAGADMGLYEYIPRENSVVNLYFAGTHDLEDKHLINVSSVMGWNSNCYSEGGVDIVKLINPDNNYSAIFNFHRSSTFNVSTASACDFTDTNTFVQ